MTGLQVLKTLLKVSPKYTLADVPRVLPSLMSKLTTAQNSPLIARLLAVCARLVLINATQIVDYLSAIPAPGKRH